MHNTSPTSVPEAAVAHEMYYVLAVDVTYNYREDETSRPWQGVVAHASSGEEACELAKTLLEEGLTPVESFTREGLQVMLRAMENSELPPGHAANLATGESSLSKDAEDE